MNIFLMPIYCLLVLFAYSYWAGYLPLLVPLIYFFASLLSFFLYFKDKKAAQNDNWRISENTLQLSSLLCGWPGSIIGQQRLRHKTKKVSFRTSFWAMVIINVSALAYLHSAHGSQILHKNIYKLEYWVVSEFGSNPYVNILLQLTRFRINI